MTQVAVRERPILMSAPMVRATLDDRKTETRRVVKVTHRTPGLAAALLPPAGIPPRPHVATELCPYGQPGDRLWVRETFQVLYDGGYDGDHRVWTILKPRGDVERRVVYGADHKERMDREADEHGTFRWRPSIYMPRWASRISLEVTEVRVERLHEITEADARAEGCDWSAPTDPTGAVDYGPPEDREDPRVVGYPPAGASFAIPNYHRLWDSLNASRGYGWDANPWVWVIRFRRITS